MKTIVQRAARGQVVVGGEVVGSIGRGAVLLVGVEEGDTLEDAHATAEKIAKMRFFPGATPMDRTLLDVGGACLVISQFTLAATIRKGNRPGFSRAMDPEPADVLYRAVVERLEALGVPTATGVFGAEMSVELVNAGPVTFIVQSTGGKIQ